MSARNEALKALEHVGKLLTGPDLDPLGKKLVLATLEHAKECVVAIVENKRPRKKPATT